MVDAELDGLAEHLKTIAVRELACAEFEALVDAQLLSGTLWMFHEERVLRYPLGWIEKLATSLLLLNMWPVLGLGLAVGPWPGTLALTGESRVRWIALLVWASSLACVDQLAGHDTALAVSLAAVLLTGISYLWDLIRRKKRGPRLMLRDAPNRNGESRRIDLELHLKLVRRLYQFETSCLGSSIARSVRWFLLATLVRGSRSPHADRLRCLELEYAVTLAMLDRFDQAKEILRIGECRSKSTLTKERQHLLQASLDLHDGRREWAIRRLVGIQEEWAGALLVTALAQLQIGNLVGAGKALADFDARATREKTSESMMHHRWSIGLQVAAASGNENDLKALLQSGRRRKAETVSGIPMFLTALYQAARSGPSEPEGQLLLAECRSFAALLDKESVFGTPSGLARVTNREDLPRHIQGDMSVVPLGEILLSYLILGETARLLNCLEDSVSHFDRALGLALIESDLTQCVPRSILLVLALALVSCNCWPKAAQLLKGLPPIDDLVSNHQQELVTAAIELCLGRPKTALGELKAASDKSQPLSLIQAAQIVSAWQQVGTEGGSTGPNASLLAASSIIERRMFCADLVLAAVQAHLGHIQAADRSVDAAMRRFLQSILPFETHRGPSLDMVDRLFEIAATLALSRAEPLPVKAVMYDARLRSFRQAMLFPYRSPNGGWSALRIAQTISTRTSIDTVRSTTVKLKDPKEIDSVFTTLIGIESTAKDATKRASVETDKFLEDVRRTDEWAIKLTECIRDPDHATEMMLDAKDGTNLWFYWTHTGLECVKVSSNITWTQCPIRRVPADLSKLEQMIAHINALFALGNAQAAHERIDSLGNQIMGSILQDVKSGPVRLIAPRELRSLPWEALHVRGSERLADNRAVLHANGAGSSQAFRSMEVGPCYAVGLAENGFLRRGWQQATSSEDLSGLENPLAVWFSHSFHMCTDDALGSFFAHEGPSSIGRRVGATCLANLGNNGSPIVAITRVAGTPWAKGEPEDLTGLAILGGAQALLRVRWSLSPAESEMLEFFLAERLREPEVGPLALARLIGENERLRPIRPAIEISGPLVRTRRNARLSLVN